MEEGKTEESISPLEAQKNALRSYISKNPNAQGVISELAKLENQEENIQVSYVKPKEQQSEKGVNTCPECNGKGEWENHEDSICQFERCSSCNGTGKASEALLNAIYNELQKEAYDINHHVYDYKITNQIIRKRFESYASQAVADREKEIVDALDALQNNYATMSTPKDSRFENGSIAEGVHKAINLITKKPG